MSSPPSAGRFWRAGTWRRWSSTGSTPSATGGSRRGWTRGRRTSAGPSPTSCAIGRTWRPSGRPWPPPEWEADAPYCTFAIPYGERTVTGRFFGNEAALSKLPALWFQALVRRLPELERRGRTFLSARAGLGTEGLELDRFSIGLDRKIGLIYQREESQVVRFEPDFSLSEDQMALEQPEGGAFLAFVLLEQPEWDGEQFKRDLRDPVGHPLLHPGDRRRGGGRAPWCLRQTV